MRGSGIDCVGLPIMVGRQCGFASAIAYKERAYARTPHAHWQLRQELISNMIAVPLAEMVPSDLLLMTWRTEPTHVAFLANYLHPELDAPYSIIHSLMGVDRRGSRTAQDGQVSEHILNDEWLSRILGPSVYRFAEAA